MSGRELDAAGITDPALRDAYFTCRRLNARHGRTYFLATRLLPRERRPAVHALYGFARWADDIVDGPAGPAGAAGRARALARLNTELHRGTASAETRSPVVRALVDTARRYGIDQRLFTDFLTSIEMDLHVTDYPTYRDLRVYMHGSAAVIGLQMLPILGTVVPVEEAAPHAAALGEAFQLTNFLRDVGEDLDRDRVYLPGELLAAHGVDRELLRWSRDRGRSPERVRAAFRDMEALTRRVYREAVAGIAMLDPLTRPCVHTAYVLYSRILDEIAAREYPVLHHRATVSRRRRALVATRGLGTLVW
ncbi:phytoene/squalene synthase family protein, partial [Streptomyces sp. SID3343]|uniref:squalene/phytoene synthase family protein n=1 Tax=Streptomyces sp. SID3343 TaxID=2690260 RepID=UPI00136EE409|nr:squalene/phytoene synthase family protein [Streptomyces sp. SID3343]